MTTRPTEAEIREAIRLRATLYPDDDPVQKLREAIEDLGAFMASPAFAVMETPDQQPEDDADDVWTNLRPSEARVLNRIYREALATAEHDALALITNVLTTAALKFAEEFPDAPRATPGTIDPAGGTLADESQLIEA